ncbi:MAG: nucleoside triphosphate pyrophosphohydrolase [Gammaproteobacteria bacterium]|nr:nucleoside triphosphate pyrophosphohydrolase [Gammaproteobacteria bacterium]MCP5298463.1 nucleoside triphosphate pyrophosphohydrolase [Chromatiaceae bacterium]
MDPLRRLLDIMARLRDPQHGCPWDLRQTYATIVPYTLEEAYEVADAIERGDIDELRTELGDLLFQVVFYSRLAEEDGHFTFDDVVRAIGDKMQRRHPHVFADARFDDEQDLREAWEQAKADERAAREPAGPTSQMDGIARTLPALIRAEKLQKRAARVGFDWPDVRGAFDKSREEFDEIEAEWRGGDRARLQDELGDLLFAMVNVVRLLGLDAEQTLSLANRKFERRFRAVEDLLGEQGEHDLAALSLQRLDEAWEAVKRRERDNEQGT